MKYEVCMRATGLLQNVHTNDQCIVTQDGLVAWWDQSQGWCVDEDQEQYKVVVTEA